MLRPIFLKVQWWGSVCSWVFFRAGWVLAGLLLPGAYAPVHGERHDQHEAIQAIRGLKLGGLQLKTTTFNVRKGRFDAPAARVITRGRLGWWAVHCDDSRVLMACLVQNPQMRRHFMGEQPHVG